MLVRKCWKKMLLSMALCLSMITGILSGMGELRKAKAASLEEANCGYRIWIGGIAFAPEDLDNNVSENLTIDSADNTGFKGTAELEIVNTEGKTTYKLTLEDFENKGVGEYFNVEPLATVAGASGLLLSEYHNDGITGAAIICDCDGDLEIVLKGESKITAEKYDVPYAKAESQGPTFLPPNTKSFELVAFFLQ